MRVTVLTEASGHQGVAPVGMCSVYRSPQAFEISTRSLQDREANSIKAGRTRPHLIGQWQIGTTPFGDPLASGLPVLREEESFARLDDCRRKRSHDT
jgi:hypothetical protein